MSFNARRFTDRNVRGVAVLITGVATLPRSETKILMFSSPNNQLMLKYEREKQKPTNIDQKPPTIVQNKNAPIKNQFLIGYTHKLS